MPENNPERLAEAYTEYSRECAARSVDVIESRCVLPTCDAADSIIVFLRIINEHCELHASTVQCFPSLEGSTTRFSTRLEILDGTLYGTRGCESFSRECCRNLHPEYTLPYIVLVYNHIRGFSNVETCRTPTFPTGYSHCVRAGDNDHTRSQT